MNRGERNREKARRRREKRKQEARSVRVPADSRGAEPDETCPRVAMFYSRETGELVDPVPHLSKLPRWALSDALVTVMEPYIPWPPHESELAELEAWLLLAGAVWNTTLTGTGRLWGERDLPRRVEDLRGVVEFEAGALIAEIAQRKRKLFPDDARIVTGVRVMPNGKRTEVLAMSAMFAS